MAIIFYYYLCKLSSKFVASNVIESIVEIVISATNLATFSFVSFVIIAAITFTSEVNW